MIPKYYRCGDPSNQCPLSVTKEIIKEVSKDGKDCSCPCSNPNCVDSRESVSFIEGITGGKSWIVYSGAGVIVAIILLLLLFSGNDPCIQKLQDFQTRLTPLEKEVVTLTNKPKSNTSDAQLKINVATLESDTKKLEQSAQKAMESKDEASIEILVSDTTKSIQSAKVLAESLDKPEAGSGVMAAESKAIIGKLISLQQEVEEQLEIAETQCQKHVSEFETINLSIATALSHARRIGAPDGQRKTVDIKLTASVKKCISDLQSIQSKLSSFVPPAKKPEIPFPLSEANLMVGAAPGIAERLVSPLMASWSESKVILGPDGLLFLDGGTGKKIVITPLDAAQGFKALAAGELTLYIADRSPTATELGLFGSGFKESRSVAEVIALDALTLLVHPESPIDTFEVGKSLSLTAVAGPNNSAIRLKSEQFSLNATADSEVFGEEAAIVNKNILACGLYHQEGQNLRAKRLAVKASNESAALKPSPFTIATEEYLYSYRIVAWTTTKPSDHALSFVKFVTSNPGQAIVEQCGFVDLRLRPIPGDIDPKILAALGAALGVDSISSAQRLSTNIRFAVGDAQLDLKAQADIERITREAASNYPTHKVVILGFTDSSGGPTINQPLSIKRAEAVAVELRRSKVDTRAGGLGDSFPIDTNDTEAGKARNRRAEVWVVKP